MCALRTGVIGVILLVEDDPAVRETFAVILHSVGYELREAETCEDALSLMSQVTPQLILLDWIFQKGMSGSEFLRRLRSSGISTPIIVVTGYVDELDLRSAKELGVISVILEKPLIPSTLLNIVREYMDPKG